ncbi:unnamed protein product [Cyclocybe aegerita]|uniref:Zn(2)-C6 fungal-type domain-containing protein n=1 Tax=Cyclocybe aegerita TaxID=1973307 RepID=A0A8S0WVZ5_CYCAE|nr:unnamed protein product [Cyclocybe aegerita]
MANYHWQQSQNSYPPLQLEQEFDYVGDRQQQQQQQQPYLQQRYQSPDSYAYPQQQQQLQPQSSSLHGAFAAPQNPVQSHSRSSSATFVNPQNPLNAGAYAQSVYGSQQNTSQPPSAMGQPYRSTSSNNFTFSAPTSAMQGIESRSGHNLTSTFLTSSSDPLRDSLPQPSGSSQQQQQQSYYHLPSNDVAGQPQPKRHHGQAFKDPEDQETDPAATEPKDGRAKLARACARCKNLKVRCEAKTDTEPCKRCFNGGHECVIPGRKIRRTPPKREHLLNEIQEQAKEIERLMMELEKLNAASSSKTQAQRANPDRSDSLHSPVLSPSSTSASFFGGSDHEPTVATAGDGDNNNPNGALVGTNPNDPAVNKAVEDWIAKARESLHEFGAFIGIGGAGMPKSYLVEADLEDSSDDGEDDEEFVDVSEDLEGFGSPDDHYDVAVERPEDDGTVHGAQNQAQGNSGSLSSTRTLQHKTSTSSMGTAATPAASVTAVPRKKNTGENARPAGLPVEASPFGLFGNLSLKGPRSRAGSEEPDGEDKGPGIANENFFRPTPAPNALGRRLESAQHQAPAILTRGIISPQEAEKLFKIYFDNMNLSVSLLDPVLYTAQRTFYRSPFLFTVICAIASRFYSERPGLYAQAMHFAQLAAGTALISGNKNVEMCQAYILLSLYPVPARKWEDQRSWLYLGLAIRCATDLNLHLPTTAKPLNENHAREMLNRTRVWMNCLNLDRSTGSQYGKPPIISPKDYIANHCENWWRDSPFNLRHFDIHVSAYNSELKVMAAFIAQIYSNPDHPTGLNKDVDFEAIATATDDELKALGDRWFSIIGQTDMTDPQNSFRTGLLRLAYSYSRLIALSYGFQHAFGKSDGKDENPFLVRCLKAASDVVDAVVNDICRPSQLHFFRHGPEAQSVFVTFASAFLVKLLQPKFASYLTTDQRVDIRNLVQKVIDLLGSPEVAIDERHGPKLYSRFLEKLLAKPMARLDPMSPGSAASLASTTSSHKHRRLKSASATVTHTPSTSTSSLPGQTPDSSASMNFDIPTQVYNHPSPSTSSSLSPPPTEAALSFESFAPINGYDPFGPESVMGTNAAAAISSANGANGAGAEGMALSGDFFSPSLAFDDEIMQSVQSLSDPNGWHDVPLPGFNWMTQFQQNLGLDLNSSGMYNQNMNFMTGPAQ